MACAVASSALPDTGATTEVCFAMAAAMLAKACTHVALGDVRVWVTGMAQSITLSFKACTWAPRRAAWRMRWASNGWSLRKLLPTTNTRSRVDKDATEVPNQRT